MNFILAITAIIGVGLSIINLRLLRIHSSPKPFIKVEELHMGSYIGFISKNELLSGNTKIEGRRTNTEQNFSPSVALNNWGKGVAVNVRVYSNAIDPKTGNIEIVKLEGPSVIPDASIFKEQNYYAVYNSERKDVWMPERLRITIDYESDSGYKRKVVWEYKDDQFALVDSI